MKRESRDWEIKISFPLCPSESNPGSPKRETKFRRDERLKGAS